MAPSDALSQEYRQLAPLLPFPYDLERIVDDWIALCYLVGNDFLPHLPTLDIAEAGLDTLFAIYKEELPKMGGYLTFMGEIHPQRLVRILQRLGELENEIFENRVIEERRFRRRRALRNARLRPHEEEFYGGFSPSDSSDTEGNDDLSLEQYMTADGQVDWKVRGLHL